MHTTSLHPIEKRELKYRETAYAALKEAILSGQLAPDRPLVEEQLAAILHTSRTPVREALAILEHEGLIGLRGGRGLYVRSLTRQEFVELFVANEIVEPDLVRRAARLATDEDLHVIAETISRGRFHAAQSDLPRFLQAGREFHRLIGVAAENEPLTGFIAQNQERADLYQLAAGKTISAEDMRASSDQHEAILDAIVRRDPDEAARLAIVHAHSTRVHLASLFSDEEEGQGKETDQIDGVYG